MDCKICFEKYDDFERKPNVLNCGHLFCVKCLNTLPEQKCPKCQQTIISKSQIFLDEDRETESNYIINRDDDLSTIAIKQIFNEIKFLDEKFSFNHKMKQIENSKKFEVFKNEVNIETNKLTNIIFNNQDAILSKIEQKNKKFDDKTTELLKHHNEVHLKVESLKYNFNSNKFEIGTLNEKLKEIKKELELNLSGLSQLENKYQFKPSLDLNIGKLIQTDENFTSEEQLKEQIEPSNDIIRFFDKKMISCSWDNTLKMWDLKTASCLKTFEGHSGLVFDVKMYDKDKLISCSSDQSIKIWDINTGICLKSVYGHSNGVTCIQILSEFQIISSSFDKTIKIWDIIQSICIKTLESHIGAVIYIQIVSKDEIISCSDDKTIKLWNLNEGVCTKTFVGHSAAVCFVQVLSDKTIASCSDDETIKIWEMKHGFCLKTLKGHTGPVSCIQIFNSGNLISSSNDKTVKIWDISSGNCLRTLCLDSAHKDEIWFIKIINSEILVTCSKDKTIKLWNFELDKCLTTFKGHSDGVVSASIM